MANQVSPNQITIINAKPNFINLSQKTQALIKKYNNAYGAEDARTEFFVQYFLLNLWLLIQFDNFLGFTSQLAFILTDCQTVSNTYFNSVNSTLNEQQLRKFIQDNY